MKSFTLAGLVLLLIAFAAFTYQGFTYTTSESVVDAGPIQIYKEEDHSIPLPPLVGGIALVAGTILLALGFRKAA